MTNKMFNVEQQIDNNLGKMMQKERNNKKKERITSICRNCMNGCTKSEHEQGYCVECRGEENE